MTCLKPIIDLEVLDNTYSYTSAMKKLQGMVRDMNDYITGKSLSPGCYMLFVGYIDETNLASEEGKIDVIYTDRAVDEWFVNHVIPNVGIKYLGVAAEEIVERTEPASAQKMAG